MKTVSQIFGFTPHALLDKADTFIVGVECEIESIAEAVKIPCFTKTTDGSLRNNGYEYISDPLYKQELLAAFSSLHSELIFHNREEAFSERTSTHVHVNCRGFTLDQVKNLVLMYALFEEFFFVVAGPKRKDNIHCVPLTYTYLPALYNKSPETFLERWHKYTALNVIPITRQGTVEFRHLIGTSDVRLMNEWLTCLENLWTLSKREQIDPAALNNPKTIHRWWKEIFQDSRSVQALEPALQSLISNTLLDVKLAFI